MSIQVLKETVLKKLSAEQVDQVCKETKLDKRKKSTWEVLLSLSIW